MSRWRPSGELAVFAVATPLLALMTSAGITWMDSGELAAAAYALGGAHPPGHPGHTVLGKLATLLPVGEIAFRVALLSAAGMAAAAAGTVALARALVASERTAAIAAGAMVALSPVVQLNATRVEVYGPVTALLVWAMVFTLRFQRHGRGRDALVTALLCGGAATLHPVIAAAAALPMALAVLRRCGRRRPRLLLLSGAAGLLLLLVYLYLPVRASAADPAVPFWGAPTDAGALWKLVTGAGYRDNFVLAGTAGRFAELVLLCGEGLGLGLLFGGMVGLCFGAASRLPGAGVVLASAACVILAAALQGAFNPDMPGYVAPALAMLAAGLAPLVGAVLRMMPGDLGRARPLAAGAILLPVLGIGLIGSVSRAADSGFRRGDAPTRHTAATVGQMPPGPGLYLAHGDHALFTAQYERVVAGHRPDIAIAERELIRDRWFAEHVDHQRPELYVPFVDDGVKYRSMADALVIGNLVAGRPVGGDDWQWNPEGPSVAAPMGLGFLYGVEPDQLVAVELPHYDGAIGARVRGRVALVHALYLATRGRLREAAVTLELGDRFDDADLAALAAAQPRPDRPPLFPRVPSRTRVFIHAPWQAAFLADDLAWLAGVADGAGPPPAVYERRVHWTWRRVLSDGRSPADPELPRLDADAWAGLGQLLVESDPARAALAYRRALALDPDHAEARRALSDPGE